MKIICYVVASIDGYIKGPKQTSDKFIHEKTIVDYYLNDLKNYDTTIMERKTCDYGYKFGLKTGEAPYSHMQHYIFSETLHFNNQNNRIHVVWHNIDLIKDLKNLMVQIFIFVEERFLQDGF
jgi:hypothetical protein